MGGGKSKLHPCPLFFSWGKGDCVETKEGQQKPHFVALEKISREPKVTGEVEEKAEEDEDEEFLKFVILHAQEDTYEALRVQSLLQNEFGIKPGIIFAEMPCGRQHLQNLDDAVNGSAWTILLLTENFLQDTWCRFQFDTSLMNSVNRQHKYNSVIPMRPLSNPLPRERTPLALRTINALEEGSRGFATQVERIFQESVYETQKTIWKEMRNAVPRHLTA
ncbi:TIR domain-containing adapter molecule 2 [Sorex fumeus]|uniref:TIR domain-containing adapter molecule 2 n=1 Tax=Sorex fumeus TaxID=62283 RepID=UPI0024AE80F5|nr:TIR domain-containing adapter molecule 2 [Sorex fumeus]